MVYHCIQFQERDLCEYSFPDPSFLSKHVVEVICGQLCYFEAKFYSFYVEYLEGVAWWKISSLRIALCKWKMIYNTLLKKELPILREGITDLKKGSVVYSKHSIYCVYGIEIIMGSDVR